MNRGLVLKALTAMRLAGLNDYGRWPRSDQELAVMADVYASALERAGCESQDVPSAANRLIDHGGDFPDAARFARECLGVLYGRTVTIGRELEPGVIRLDRLPLSEARELPAPEPPSEADKAAVRQAFAKLKDRMADKGVE